MLRGRIEQKRNRLPIAAAIAGLAAAAARGASGWRGSPPWLRWALVAQCGLIAAAGLFAISQGRSASYHALGAAPTLRHGDIVVIFRPDASERGMRETLKLSHARVVDGPTSADAYLLSTPLPGRAEALAKLRAAPQVVMAEPIDSEGPQ
jgi:hypothetical protein